MGTEICEALASWIPAVRKNLEASGGQAFETGSDGYEHAIRLWNGAVQRRPGLVVQCFSATDVRTALMAARDHRVPISVRGGGQDWAGRSLINGGLVIDLSGMRQVSIDLKAKEATVAGGATAVDLGNAMASCDLAAVTGNTGDVSMAGLILGGGYGLLQTRFGVASDSLLGAEVVLADGRILTADASENSDLFWALRGGVAISVSSPQCVCAFTQPARSCAAPSCSPGRRRPPSSRATPPSWHLLQNSSPSDSR